MNCNNFQDNKKEQEINLNKQLNIVQINVEIMLMPVLIKAFKFYVIKIKIIMQAKAVVPNHLLKNFKKVTVPVKNKLHIKNYNFQII